MTDKESRDSSSGSPRQVLSIAQAATLIVGIVIGAGIFKTPALVATMTGSDAAMFLAWILGGAVSLIGALCYAELASSHPDAGGDYRFLFKAFGPSVAFLFGWARLSVITTGSIALLGFVFGDYMNRIICLDFFGEGSGPFIYAVAVIFLLSLASLNNVRTGMFTQSVFTALQVFCLVVIFVSAVYMLATGHTPPAPSETASSSFSFKGFGLAMVFVLLTFGGWNEAAYLSGEMKGGHKSIVKALVWAVVIITGLYLMVTWAYWQGLGFDAMKKSPAIAADLMAITFGGAAETVISLMIAISALTSINATIIVGARTSYAMGCDWPVFRWLGVWNTKRDTPSNALWVQCAASLLLVVAGKLTGGGFKSMVEFTAPVFWLFFLLAGISVFVLRKKEPDLPRPFKVPFYPVIPVLFCLTCAYMLYSSLSYVYDQKLGGMNAAWIGVIVLLIGLAILAIINRFRKPTD